MPRPPNLLVVSNGHGEDQVGARLAAALAGRTGGSVAAAALVGDGRAYRDAGIPLAAPAVPMPSGGFVLHDRGALVRDLRAGLARALVAQLGAVASWRGRVDAVVAVGDLLPVAVGRLAGAPVALVGVNKSDWYDAPGSRYIWPEVALLRAWDVLVLPRDARTARRLQALGVRAPDLGNPLVDGLEPRGAMPPRGIGLLPGSRGDAERNLGLLLPVAGAIARAAARPVRFHLASPAVDAAALRRLALPLGGVADGDGVRFDGAEVRPCGFAETLAASDVVLGLAGTANEQAVALGVPVLAFPVPSGQYVEAFARLQAQLLGPGLTLRPYEPGALAAEALVLASDPGRRAAVRAAGAERMGPPGATERIAEALAAWAGAGPESFHKDLTVSFTAV